MKLNSLLLLLAFGCINCNHQSTEQVRFPDWIIGRWSNTGCSDSERIMTIEFDKQKFHLKNKMFSERRDVMEENSQNSMTYSDSKNYLGLFFIDKNEDTISYEFKVGSSLDKSVLLWDFNNPLGRQGFFSNDVNFVLEKLD